MMAKDVTTPVEKAEIPPTEHLKEIPEVESPAKSAEGGPKAAKKKKKIRRSVSRGQVHVRATFNNTIVTITDEQGNALASSSAGSAGFRGSKKGTAYGAQVAAEKAIETGKTFGLSKVDVLIKGVGLGRDAAVRALAAQRIEVDSIKDITTIPHGGVRPRKAKRN